MKDYRKYLPGLESISLLIISVILLTLFSLAAILSYTTFWYSGIILIIIFFISIPPIFKICPSFQRNTFYMNNMRLNFKGYSDFQSFNIHGARNLKIPVDDGYIGAWHLIPQMYCISQKLEKIEDYCSKCLRDDDKCPIVIYFHGNMGTRALGHRVELYNLLQRENAHVIAIDYRSFGDGSNINKITETSLVKDCITVYEWAARNSSSNAKIYFWGHSLGTAVATIGGAKIESMEGSSSKFKGLILESPFTNMEEEIKNIFATKIFKFYPKFDWFFASSLSKLDARFEIDESIKNISVPTMILATDNDNIVPFFLSRKLYEILVDDRKSKNISTTVEFHKFPSHNIWNSHAFIVRDANLSKIIQTFLAEK